MRAIAGRRCDTGAAPKQSSAVVLEAGLAGCLSVCLPGVVSLVVLLVLRRHGRPLG
jgi:hypothetical protein